MVNLKTKKPKHIKWRKLFSIWMIKLITVMFFFVLLWVCCFIPDSVINWIISKVGIAKNIGAMIFPSITAAFLVLTFCLFILGDPLLYGNSKSSKYFRSEFPSNKLAKKYGISSQDATSYFISYYDCWQYDCEPQHELYLETTKAHYDCLFVFLLKPLTFTLLGLSILFLLLNIFYYKLQITDTTIIGQGVIICIYAICLFLIISLHKIPTKRNNDPVGCWAAWKNRCEENYSEFLAACGEKKLLDFYNETRIKLNDLRKQAQA